MPQDEVLICRRCKVAAQSEIVDGEVASIACPTCGISVEGDVAREVHLNQARYFAMHKVQNVFRRTFSKGGSFRYQPGRINDPRGPFIIGKPES